MNSSKTSLISSVASRILRPLARIMLRNGLSCKEFEELVRKAYVDECINEAKISRQKVTISSVSAQTGLSRKEVKRLHEVVDDSQQERSSKYNKAVRVISGWLNDRRFSNDENQALPLALEAETCSFAELVKDYSGDVPTVAMLKSLEAAGCVHIKDGVVHLVKHAYVPGDDSDEILNILGTDTHQLINTIDHNLQCSSDQRRFQRKVSNLALREDDVAEFKQLVHTTSQSLLETLDQWLDEHEAGDDEESRYVSLSIFYFEQHPEREDAS